MNQPELAAAKEEALAAFRASGAAHRNCAQAVLHVGLRLLDSEPENVILARYFGGGISRSGLACGALTGAALVLGFRDQSDPAAWTEERLPEGQAQLQALLEGFQQEFGAVNCAELTGCDLRTPEGSERFATENVRETRCVDFIKWTSDRVATLLSTQA